MGLENQFYVKSLCSVVSVAGGETLSWQQFFLRQNWESQDCRTKNLSNLKFWAKNYSGSELKNSSFCMWGVFVNDVVSEMVIETWK